jgi:hypothetical protein
MTSCCKTQRSLQRDVVTPAEELIPEWDTFLTSFNNSWEIIEMQAIQVSASGAPTAAHRLEQLEQRCEDRWQVSKAPLNLMETIQRSDNGKSDSSRWPCKLTRFPRASGQMDARASFESGTESQCTSDQPCNSCSRALNQPLLARAISDSPARLRANHARARMRRAVTGVTGHACHLGRERAVRD